MSRKFKLWHSVAGLAALVVLQEFVLRAVSEWGAAWFVLVCAAAGAAITLYVATEVIVEVRNARHMLTLLSVVVGEFIMFFALEYWFLTLVSPGAFPALPQDAISLTLHSTMVFVFNPLYMPGDSIGRALLLINTAGALGLVLFILQNIWQFRR